MKNLSKSFLLFLGLAAFSVANAAPQYPFPQNKAYPYGNTFQSAVTDSIKSHFNVWKKAWYTEAGTFYAKYGGASENANKAMPSGTARIISPNSHAELSVSEGIAYGMLLMVYMSSTNEDHQSEFDKLWKYWKCYGKGLNGNGCSSWSGQGMEWQVDNYDGSIGSGTASDAEFDAAVALVMASKQWNNPTYLNEAKQLIAWIKSNDMNSDASIRPGSNWNDAFNPSYAAVAAFQLFYEITNDAFWQTAVDKATSEVQLCQNAKTGLMPDWCDWNTHQPTETNASVTSGYLGFYNDATRTPWRMAWGYAWYGISKAKTSNDKIVPWLDSASYGYAGMILPGYNVDGSSDNDVYVSSDFTGGLGLSMLSADDPKSYLEGLYYTLTNTKGKDSLRAKVGEEYFASTLNVLYMLLLTGNMPNFYNMTNYTDFVPNPANVQTPKQPIGVLQDTALQPTISGLAHWGVYSDDLGVTKMFPDSGSSGIFQQTDGKNIASMEMFIAPEPTYSTDPNLKYPFAGIACSFDSEQSYHDLSDLANVRITYRSKGVIRFALLDQETLNQDKEGGEPGYFLQPTDDEWRTIDIDITANANNDFNTLTYPAWTNLNGVISASDVLKAVRGVKFDVKMQKAGYASFDLAEIALQDRNGNVVKALSGQNAIPKTEALTKALLRQSGNIVHFNAVGNNAKLSVYNLNGTLLSTRMLNGSGEIALDELAPARGLYVLRLSTAKTLQFLKIQK
ncbi:glycosyl hydrolase family 8 [Fibrobacter intestinalis]|uniref:cellulase n=1 Tax=Fibrobacter intestinalis TaxID=28122 RepID=A0A1T4PV62_9BACT|nr:MULTISPECIES: glycosyl hydrolase family 8 [Fibrobacter]PBC74855.1 glycosyl hydrolase family 8 [Fibrobacter sp. NR9]SJZ95435.1 Por secretion system C-terminal sorting domain-containing protein [Fibrobacter intestinalis]